MKHSGRDLLVLFRQGQMSPRAIDSEVEQLHEMLSTVERTDNLASVCEIIDVNSYHIFHKQHKVRTILLQPETKPFVFINCLN